MKTRILPLITMFLVASRCLYASDRSSVVLEYDFEDTAITTAIDRSGYGNDGTIYGPRFRYGGTSHPSMILDFDGIDDYIVTPDSYSLGVDYVTAEAWVYMPEPGSFTIMNKENDFEFSLIDGELRCAVATDTHGLTEFRSGLEVPLNYWSHVAFTYDGRQINLYLNGVTYSPIPFAGGPLRKTGGNLYAGVRRDGEILYNHFRGILDDVVINNRALSADELGIIYIDIGEDPPPEADPPPVKPPADAPANDEPGAQDQAEDHVVPDRVLELISTPVELRLGMVVTIDLQINEDFEAPADFYIAVAGPSGGTVFLTRVGFSETVSPLAASVIPKAGTTARIFSAPVNNINPGDYTVIAAAYTAGSGLVCREEITVTLYR